MHSFDVSPATILDHLTEQTKALVACRSAASRREIERNLRLLRSQFQGLAIARNGFEELDEWQRRVIKMVAAQGRMNADAIAVAMCDESDSGGFKRRLAELAKDEWLKSDHKGYEPGPKAITVTQLQVAAAKSK